VDLVIRRSFRLGLTLGLLGGLAFALVKMLGGRAGSSPAVAPVATTPWPPLDPDTVQPHGEAVVPQSQGDAVAPAPPPTEAAAPPAPHGEAVVPAPPPTEAAAPPARPPKKAPLKAAPAPRKPAPAKVAAKKVPAKKAGAKKAAGAKQARSAWVEPAGDVCPTSHPVKAKLASKIFHVPGMLNYLRTKPDRCYRDARAAEADGLRPAKR
jgi:hypothetical protein